MTEKIAKNRFAPHNAWCKSSSLSKKSDEKQLYKAICENRKSWTFLISCFMIQRLPKNGRSKLKSPEPLR